MVCRICQSPDTKIVCRAREMMIGLRETFDYFECASCGCVQIVDFPRSMEKYYAGAYYSMQIPESVSGPDHERELRRAARLNRFAGLFGIRQWPLRFVPKHLPLGTRILDVGAGAGLFVSSLYRAGYRSVHGIDPNLDESKVRVSPFRLERANSDDLVRRGDKFGFIYLSHSLEHMPEQRRELEVVRALLEEGGTCCIRIPWVSSDAWERYGPNWVQLDAPRHFYLHSKKSFEHLVASAGFRIAKLWCDSTGIQFWGSEQYANDIPLYSDRSWLVAPESSLFSKAQIDEFERQAERLNDEGRGDQIVAWLEIPPN
jgi:SAM-dependent methyltransferase